MIVDIHGHYTTAPQSLWDWRKLQSSGAKPPPLKISDDQIRESLEGAQLRLQRERGTDVTFFSPRASTMEHHVGDASISLEWTRLSNDLIHRCCSLYPKNFVPVGQLPQFPGIEPKHSIAELQRCVNELGCVGVNLNPDPSGGNWKDPPLTDKWW